MRRRVCRRIWRSVFGFSRLEYSEHYGAGHILNDDGEALLREVLKELPGCQDWLVTPNQLLGGDTPEERILARDVEGVRNLLQSILYIGVV